MLVNMYSAAAALRAGFLVEDFLELFELFELFILFDQLPELFKELLERFFEVVEGVDNVFGVELVD